MQVSELSGDFRNACLAIVDHACDPTFYVCRRLYHTMHGWGTSDWALINFVVDHCEVRKYSALCRGGEVFRCGFVFTACIALVSAHPACFHQLPLLGLQRDMDLVKERFPGVVSDISKDGKPKFLGEMIRGDTSGTATCVCLCVCLCLCQLPQSLVQ